MVVVAELFEEKVYGQVPLRGWYLSSIAMGMRAPCMSVSKMMKAGPWQLRALESSSGKMSEKKVNSSVMKSNGLK